MTENKNRREGVLSRHAQRIERHILQLEALDRRFFWARLWFFLAGALLSFLAIQFGPPWLGWTVLLLSVASFSALVALHRRLDRKLVRARITLRLNRTQLARINLDWANLPAPVFTSSDRQHPFESDLDLTGERSLHRLLDTAISQGGGRLLRDWLLQTTPDLEAIQERQAILREIRPQAGFRQRLALNGALVSGDPRQRWDGEVALAWLEQEGPGKSLLPALALLGVMAGANALLFTLNAVGLLPPYWILSLILYGAVYTTRYRELKELFGDAYRLGDTLNRFKAVLAYLEEYPYRPGSRLARLCAPFWNAGQRPSGYLRRIAAIAAGASMQNNPIAWMLLNTLMPWDLLFAHLLNVVKGRVKRLLPQWLETWRRLEALNSLANFAYLNPNYAFPEVSRDIDEGGAVFWARELGHPLIPVPVRINNAFSLGKLGEVAIVTGSNMSGKSTFLRTVGVNLALAFAGGPAAAAEMRTIPFRVFTSMTLSDSLSDGISFFYAEVRRLKALLLELEREDPMPVFFLIDEIFRGTNNKERQINALSSFLRGYFPL